MRKTAEESIYDKLSPQRKQLVDMVLENLKNGTGLWKKGWKTNGAPESGITGKRYKGINNLYLTFISMTRGYSDNRWVTFHQMEEHDWHFKTDDDGNSLGKGAGVCIEFFELRDKETKQRFDNSILDGMTLEEREEYEKENVYPMRKYYRVFNADIIEGIPVKVTDNIDERGRNERTEKFIDNWNQTESKIIYGGNQAYYNAMKDEIHLPKRSDFVDSQDYYSTALHEIGHSTGHEKRLNRGIQNKFGNEEYAIEELRAEFASMFMEQDFNISVSENHIRNNSEYIKNWYDEISEDPNLLFTVIADANIISKFLSEKESKFNSIKIEPYAIIESDNQYGETVYKVYMAGNFGQTILVSGNGFTSREALNEGLKKLQQLPYLVGKELREVGFGELSVISKERMEFQKMEEEKSKEYIKPSELILSNTSVDMKERGIESLTRMSDREVVERAGKTKNGEKFYALYNGLNILGSDYKNECSLMTRLAMFSSDKEQLIRIFRSSGQYRDTKSNNYYDDMAEHSLKFIANIKNNSVKHNNDVSRRKGGYGINAKS